MKLALAAFAVLVALSRPADACSIVDIYIDPTQVEYTEQAVGIVVAEIDVTKLADREHPQALPFVVREVFKGPYKPGASIVVFGDLEVMQLCTTPSYTRGEHYVVYLDANGSAVEAHSIRRGDLASRYAIAELVRIMGLPTYADRRVELYAAKLRGGKGVLATEGENRLAAIIEWHFDTPTPWKTFAELAPLLRHKHFYLKERVIYSIGKSADPAAGKFMTDLLHGLRTMKELPYEELRAIANYFSKVKVPAATDDLAWLYAKIPSDWRWHREMTAAHALHAP